MIPVLGIPVLNKPELLQRMFSTIDEPIGRLFIVDNGGILKGNKLKWPWDVGSVHISDPGYNMGVAASWNHIIKANMDAPWWMISSNDMKHSPGALALLADVMNNHIPDRPMLGRIQVRNEDWGNHFGTFAINAEAVEKIGWFDENLHPIYFEDTDWLRRIERLGGVSMPLIPSKTFHDGNESWKGNTTLAPQNKKSWDGNVEYFDHKWSQIGAGAQTHWVASWRPPALSRLRKQAWKIDRKDSGT